MSKVKIKLNWRRYEYSLGNTNGWGAFSGNLIGYTREDGGPSGAFAEHLLPLYDTIFEIANKEFIKQNKDE